MCKGKDIEQQTAEEFDRFIRQELLDEANELRKEKGLPPITENDLDNLGLPEDKQ